MILPTELLSEIFVQCLRYQISPVNWHSPLPASYSESLPLPLLFTKVCRLWRSVAQLTPSLWAALPRIGIRDISPGGSGDNLLRMYLAHSGRVPLSLGIYIQSNHHGAYIAALLSQHLHRAKVLIISYDGDIEHSPFEQLLFDLRGKFDLLTHFRLDYNNFKFRSSPYVDAFAGAPRLTHVRIPSVSGTIDLPWSQITYYRGHCCDLKSICQKLPLCQRLETLHIDSGRPDIILGDMGSIAKSIVLPYLRRIYIRDADGVTHKLFDSLHAPLLEVVDIIAFQPRTILGALFRCLEQSSCITVTSLNLLGCEINVEELLHLSGLAPGLQRLDVQMISADVVQALEVTPTGDNIFPHLTKLTIRQFQVDADVLLKVCLSRCYPGDPNHLVKPVKQLACCRVCSVYEEVTRSFHDLFEAFEEDCVFQDTIERIDFTLQTITNLADGDKGHESGSVAELYTMTTQILLRRFADLEQCLEFLEPYQVTHALLLVRHNVEAVLEKFRGISEYHVARTAPLDDPQPESKSSPNSLCLRALAILDRWRPLIAEYMAGNTRWIEEKDTRGWYRLAHYPQGKTRVEAPAMEVTPGDHRDS
ncbi:hypothetical protein BD779DRAFT_1676663 [Infundibulicybe gibba]|nr:hypothetical protein BD779DRAFT_1676663 [Infundibulicybe gibba]